MTRALRRFVRQRQAMIGAIIALTILLVIVFGPYIYRQSAIIVVHDILGQPQPPSLVHLLGTDLLGRDVLARALLGGRVSLAVGLSAMCIAVCAGVLYGATAASAGGWIDVVMMRIVDALFSFPSFFLIVTVEALTNTFALGIIVLILGLLSWMGVARIVRAEVLSLRERDFVEAARALGLSPMRIILRHLIPNAMAPVIVAATLATGDNILAEAGLSYLGLGVQPPIPSWGNMLQDSLAPAARNAPWMIFTPGLLIVMTLVGFALTAEGLRVAFDPDSDEHSPATVKMAA